MSWGAPVGRPLCGTAGNFAYNATVERIPRGVVHMGGCGCGSSVSGHGEFSWLVGKRWAEA